MPKNLYNGVNAKEKKALYFLFFLGDLPGGSCALWLCFDIPLLSHICFSLFVTVLEHPAMHFVDFGS